MGLTVPDASVLIAALDADDVHHHAARRVLAAAWDAQEPIVVPVVAYAETMVRPLAIGGELLARADSFFGTQTIEPLTPRYARAAGILRARHSWLRLPDALILATAMTLGADRVLTADRRWVEVDQRVEVVTPA